MSQPGCISTQVSQGERTPLLTPSEVAEFLRVTPRTVCRYAAEGRLERVKIGQRLSRYTVESVEALIDPARSETPEGIEGSAVAEVTANGER
jgi:excisionase family DNA binding protein